MQRRAVNPNCPTPEAHGFADRLNDWIDLHVIFVREVRRGHTSEHMTTLIDRSIDRYINQDGPISTQMHKRQFQQTSVGRNNLDPVWFHHKSLAGYAA